MSCATQVNEISAERGRRRRRVSGRRSLGQGGGLIKLNFHLFHRLLAEPWGHRKCHDSNWPPPQKKKKKRREREGKSRGPGIKLNVGFYLGHSKNSDLRSRVVCDFTDLLRSLYMPCFSTSWHPASTAAFKWLSIECIFFQEEVGLSRWEQQYLFQPQPPLPSSSFSLSSGL